MSFTKISSTFGIVATLLLAACSSETKVQSGFACTASASLVSGNPGLPSSSIQINNVAVNISGGTAPFNITIPGLSAFTSSQSSYTYSATYSLTTGSAGGVNDSVAVSDSANASTSCQLSGLSGSTTTNSFTITPSPSTSVAVGSSIILSVLNPVAGATYSFTLASAVSGVIIVQTSQYQATVSSSVAATAVVNATSAAAGTSSITLYFGTNGGGSSGSLQISASSTSQAVGSIIYLTASDASQANQNWTWSIISAPGTVSFLPNGNTLQVTSVIAGTVVVGLIERASSGGAIINQAQISLNFGNGGGNGSSLACSFYAGGSSFPTGIAVNFYVTASTGESLIVSQLSPGEPWSGGVQPLMPISVPFALAFSYPGQKIVQVIAQSATRPAVYCNNGQVMSTVVNMY
ncbi:MAG: hypothetical protein HYR96_00460 [Deltaproteobacteria bacterium]|nr:hypothetical protein [Deltaproteobacteria bacterium]MBI3294741.1 hypothetical protein [Deltaproteobacteria bacterium]